MGGRDRGPRSPMDTEGLAEEMSAAGRGQAPATYPSTHPVLEGGGEQLAQAATAMGPAQSAPRLGPRGDSHILRSCQAGHYPSWPWSDPEALAAGLHTFLYRQEAVSGSLRRALTAGQDACEPAAAEGPWGSVWRQEVALTGTRAARHVAKPCGPPSLGRPLMEAPAAPGQVGLLGALGGLAPMGSPVLPCAAPG